MDFLGWTSLPHGWHYSNHYYHDKILKNNSCLLPFKKNDFVIDNMPVTVVQSVLFLNSCMLFGDSISRNQIYLLFLVGSIHVSYIKHYQKKIVCSYMQHCVAVAIKMVN